MNKQKERLKELEKLLNKNCKKYEDNCSKCPHHTECEEYSRLRQKLED